MNRNIAIVEDEVEEAETLRSYFARYTQEYGTTFTVTHFLSAEAFLNRYRPVYDLVLMDICLPKTSGMDAAALLRRVNLEEKADAYPRPRSSILRFQAIGWSTTPPAAR